MCSKADMINPWFFRTQDCSIILLSHPENVASILWPKMPTPLVPLVQITVSVKRTRYKQHFYFLLKELHITFIYISLARTRLHGKFELQRKLRNILLSIAFNVQLSFYYYRESGELLLSEQFLLST